MLALEEIKKLLADETMTDRQVADIRDACYSLAGIVLEQFHKTHQSKIDTDASANNELNQSKISTLIRRR